MSSPGVRLPGILLPSHNPCYASLRRSLPVIIAVCLLCTFTYPRANASPRQTDSAPPRQTDSAPRQTDSAPPAPPAETAVAETYRLRVQNAEYGRIEVSLDSGAHYLLIGRVTHPASKLLMDTEATTPGKIVRTGKDGFAFAVADHKILKLRPTIPASKSSRSTRSGSVQTEACTLRTNLSVRSSLFTDLLPPSGTKLSLQTYSREVVPLYKTYTLSEGDTFVFYVSVPAANGAPGDTTTAAAQHESALKSFTALNRDYVRSAIERTHGDKSQLLSGLQTLKIKLPANDPDPVVTIVYSIDGCDTNGFSNVAPYQFEWDTRLVPDGEYLIEVRGLNKNSTTITALRRLVVVSNLK